MILIFITKGTDLVSKVLKILKIIFWHFLMILKSIKYNRKGNGLGMVIRNKLDIRKIEKTWDKVKITRII